MTPDQIFICVNNRHISLAKLAENAEAARTDIPALCDAYEAQAKAIERLKRLLQEERRAIGDHNAPNDCYATGPLTGDPFRDLVQCPACSFIAMYDEHLSTKLAKELGND